MIAAALPDDLPRWCRREDGIPKLAFLSVGEARIHVPPQYAHRFEQYTCRWCGAIHNGHKRRKT